LSFIDNLNGKKRRQRLSLDWFVVAIKICMRKITRCVYVMGEKSTAYYRCCHVITFV